MAGIAWSTEPKARRPRFLRRTEVLVGILVAVLVLLGGAGFWLLRPTQYQASTALVVLPNRENDEAAGFYDTLSRGQVVQTFAEILDLRGAEGASLRGQGVSVVVEVVPETSLISVTATAGAPATAEEAADAVLASSRPYFNQLSSPYSVSEVRDAAGTAQRVGLPLGPLAGVVAVVALLAGVASAMAIRALFPLGRRGAATPSAAVEQAVPAAVSSVPGRRPGRPGDKGARGPAASNGSAGRPVAGRGPASGGG
jgi:capsular polysaccharide biosynthesis protein